MIKFTNKYMKDTNIFLHSILKNLPSEVLNLKKSSPSPTEKDEEKDCIRKSTYFLYFIYLFINLKPKFENLFIFVDAF